MTAPGLGPTTRSSIAGWAAVSIAAGVGSVLVLRHPAPLADPIACPGAFDLMAVIASRTWRDVPLGSMLAAGNAVVLVLALALLARAVHSITSAAGVTVAITLAAAASPVFAVALAPSAAAAFVVAIAAWAAVLRAVRDPQHGASLAVALVLLAVLAATVTPLAVPSAVIAGWLGWRRRSLLAVLAAGLVVGSSFLIQMAVPQGTSCVLPGRDLLSLTDAGHALVNAALAAGPLAIVLAVLGLVAIKRLPRGVAVSLLPLVLASLWGAVVMPAQPASVLAPFVLAFWLLAAAGLAEVWDAASRTTGGKVGVAALSIVLVVLQVLSATARRIVDHSPDGQERLTLATMAAVVGSLPRGAGLVLEDATTDLLTRALSSRVRTPDRFHFVPRDAPAIAEQLRTTRVFALPRSQRVLQHLGLELIDPNGGVPGLAEVRQTHACSAVLGTAASALPEISGRQQLALVADAEQSRGPIVILLPADAPLSPLPVAWTPEAMRGFHARTFDLTSSTDQTDLAAELRTYELLSWTTPNARYVTRIETWRTPGAPFVLPIALGGTAGVGTARITGTAANQHLRLCPSFRYEVRPLARRP